VDSKWRVHAEVAVDLAMSAGAVWGQMRDLPRFLATDPLHAGIRTDGPGPGGWKGVPIVIEHRLAGVGPDRVGRVLTWEEGRGFSVSDLSRRGVRVGFPHVCGYEVEATPGGSRVRVSARGVWTARFVPRWVVRAWLWWVMAGTGVAIRREFGAYGRWKRESGRPLVEGAERG
jgi:hypothetical protein